MPSDSAAIEMRPPSSTLMASMKPVAFFAQQVLGGNHAVFEDQLRCIAGTQAQLVFFLSRTRILRALFHHERRQPVRVRRPVGHRDHHQHVGIVAVGAEGLGAVQHPVLASAHGRQRALPASDPEPGSVSPHAPMNSPVASLLMYFFFCSSLPAMKM